MSALELVDLLARARRSVLSSAERTELEGALEKVPESRLLLRAGLEFDAEASAAGGDEELILRIARKVERHRFSNGVISACDDDQDLPRPSQPARPFAPLLVAALYLVIGAAAGVAGAATYFGLPSVTGKAPDAIRGANQQAPAAKALGERQVPIELKAPPVEPQLPLELKVPPVASSAPSLMPAQPRSPSVLGRVVPANPPAPGPAELYAIANRARVQGNSDAAIQAYLELQARFPGSPEAIASRLALGNLYLVSHHALAALEQFRAHQAAGGAGFGAESAWGIAAALAELGRREEERAALFELLARYPRSGYETVARRKLEQRD